MKTKLRKLTKLNFLKFLNAQYPSSIRFYTDKIAPTYIISDININTLVHNELTLFFNTDNTNHNLNLTIYNINGKFISNTKLSGNSGRANIDLNNIMPGIYLSTIADDKGSISITKRFVKLN